MGQTKQNLHALAARLEEIYQARRFDSGTLNTAVALAVGTYRSCQEAEVEAEELTAEQLRYFSTAVEVLDYFNKFDEMLGMSANVAGYFAEGQIYYWLRQKAEALLERLEGAVGWADSPAPDLLLERTRFCAAVSLNEKYRRNKADCAEGMEKLIELVEGSSHAYATSVVGPTRLRYLDTMSYLYFLFGKASRQTRHYNDAESSFSRAIVFLLDLARAHVSLALDADGEPREHLRQVHSKLMRVGVCHLARAWLYLAWGKVSKADIAVEHALRLLGEKDAASRHLAHSIRGIILRIRAGSDRELLKTTISSHLRPSYNFFASNEPVPRHAVRCLFELGIALIMSGNLKEAADSLTDLFVRKTSRGEHSAAFRKLLTYASWRSRAHVLCSRIARKDRDRQCVEALEQFVRYMSAYPMRHTRKPDAKGARATHTYRVHSYKNIALSEARKGVELAADESANKIDAYVALGEAQLSERQFDAARRSFESGLQLSKAVQAGAVSADQNNHLTATCLLNLARINLKQNELIVARQYLDEFETLRPLEHEWVNELGREVAAEFQNFVANQIVVPLEEGWKVDEAYERFMDQLALKLENMGPKEFEARHGKKKTWFYENIKDRAKKIKENKK